MTCVKTGCHIYIIPYGTFAYGDAHEVDDVYFFRLVETKNTPTAEVIHFEVNGYDSWWDKDKANPWQPSTLVVRGEDVVSYGYEGRETRLFPYVKGEA
jgi:hypothetical protein